MRTIIHGVLDTQARKIVFTSTDRCKCETKAKELGRPYEIRHTWKSF